MVGNTTQNLQMRNITSNLYAAYTQQQRITYYLQYYTRLKVLLLFTFVRLKQNFLPLLLTYLVFLDYSSIFINSCKFPFFLKITQRYIQSIQNTFDDVLICYGINENGTQKRSFLFHRDIGSSFYCKDGCFSYPDQTIIMTAGSFLPLLKFNTYSPSLFACILHA